MSSEQLWAPWRLAYVAAGEPPAPPVRDRNWLDGADQGCFLCRGVAEAREFDRENLVVARGPRTVTVLNRYPYNNGHLLVAPLRHQGRLDELDAETSAELQSEITRLIGLIERLMNPQGFNVGLNLGRVAGAGLPGHLHWHIVPRWNGDTNFMPVLTDVRIISQSLDALYELLTSELTGTSVPE